MRRILVLMALAVSLSACGSVEESGPQPEPAAIPITAVTPAPVTSAAPTEPLPLIAYIATDEQRHLVAGAFFALINRCMTKAGFPARTYPSANIPSQPQSWRYGVNDLDTVGKYGYHLPPKYQADLTEAATKDPTSTEEQYAFSGGDTEGCAGQAQRQLGKHDNLNYMDDHLAQSLSFASFDQSHRDSRVVEVISQWRECMRTAGFPATDPMDPVNFADKPKPTAKEIATAKADVLCRRQTNLFAVWHAVETAYQTSMIDANSDELEKGRRSVAIAVRAASAL